jgi:hypothetical protein
MRIGDQRSIGMTVHSPAALMTLTVTVDADNSEF